MMKLLRICPGEQGDAFPNSARGPTPAEGQAIVGSVASLRVPDPGDG